MDKNAHKRSFFKIYSSEEEIIDIDRLQEDYESESTLSSSSFEDSNEKCAIFGLEEGDTFENWDLAERQIENYSKEVGFGVKRADVKETRERKSVKIGCPWKVNLSYNKGVIRVTSICKEYNYPLFGNRNIASDRHFNPEMLEEIEFLVNIGCRAGPIIRMLQKWFSDTVIYPKNVYTAICLFWRDQKVMKTDAAKTYDKLIKMQREEHGWRSTTLYELNIQIQLQLDKEEKFERLEEQVNQNPTVGSDEKDSKVKFAKDDYESKLSNLRFLFSYLDHAVIHEIWSVTTIKQNKEHFVVLYGNTNHLCTCIWQLGRIIGSKENLPNIINPHQTRTKGASKKHLKNALENTTIKYSNNKNRQDIKKLNDKHHEKSIKELNKQLRNELQREISIHQTRYICSYCKGSGHNACSCELKKKVLGQELLDKQIFLI
ncbi:hypothetical protein C1646_673756 [Rhizophagus diaphanus]|nr:hypothetical protein C1646_673756 [Rhizophagus diaphanus] [Rhizophagus sp. MUCL 43196]